MEIEAIATAPHRRIHEVMDRYVAEIPDHAALIEDGGSQTVFAGERFGLIRFGSRTDIYLPPGMKPLVVTGQYALGGETVLADAFSNEPARQGDVR